MKFYRKYVVALICILLFYAFSTDSFLSKLKSLSYLLRLVDNYYVEEVDLNQIIDGAMHGLLEELDPHSQYIPAKDFELMQESLVGEFEGIGIEFAILDGYITVISPIPGTPSDKAGLVGGDKIIKINGESAYKIKQDEVFQKLRGPKNSSVVVTISRIGLETPFDVELIRDKIPIHSIIAAFNYSDDIGYIKINRFAQNTFDELTEAIDSLETTGMKKMILDLRNNGGGLMDQAVAILDLFINSNDTLLYTKGRIYDANSVFYARRSKDDKKMPVNILINRASASASEIVAGAFQDLDRGLVVGETSFGKGLVQKQFILDDGSAARITISRYYTPSGRQIQRGFNEGVDEYYLNLASDNREANDSLRQTLPTFKTKSGRIVYGGGGITPDIYIPLEIDFTEDTQSILSNKNRLLFKYAHHIKSNYKQKTFSKFLNNIDNQKTEELSKFVDWLTTLDDPLKIQREVIAEDWDYLYNRILSEIAKIHWGKDFSYYMLLLNDKQFQKSIENL
tara:strand:+ start:480 stop:2009 length:1530 start_codon:yes stop_codon:yes gene_type:complete